jgi:hypothetical protein
MLKDLIAQLKEDIKDISNVQEVYAYPLDGNPEKYPAIVFYPENVDNTFETTQENFKTYTFKMFLFVNLNGTTMKKVFEEILPTAFDEVVQYFDTNWNNGTIISGHRMWSRVSSNLFGVSVEQKSTVAFVEMTLQIKTLSTN